MATGTHDDLQIHTIPKLEGLNQKRDIGRGAYGAVYEVKMNGLPCVAKGLHQILLGMGGYECVGEEEVKATRTKFLQECSLLSKLKHPNIVQFLGIHHITENDVLLIMEYMHMDLDKCLDKYPNLSLPLKLSILLDVSYGLLHMHSQTPPIIHRDLTATNVLLTEGLRAKIADLGVSKILSPQRFQRAAHTKAPGNQTYMPPEALSSIPHYDTKLDIFSFGVLSLYAANQEFPSLHEPEITTTIIRNKEVQIFKRKHWIDQMGEDHTLYPLVIQCLQDRPDQRPSTKELNDKLSGLCTQHRMKRLTIFEENLLHETKAALDEAEKKIAEEAKQRAKDKEMWEAQIQEKDNQLGREMVALEQQRAALLKENEDNEIKQQYEVTLLHQEREILNQRLVVSEMQTNDLKQELRKLEGEKIMSFDKLQQLEKERTELQTALDNAVAKMEKIEDDMKQEIADLKDQIQLYEVTVEERDRMIEQLQRKYTLERKFFKSDNEDEAPHVCNNVSKMVEYYTGHSDGKMQSECFNTKIKDLGLRVEQLTEQNKELQIGLGTRQSPTASLMPSSSIMLREALQLNEAESTGLKEEITGLRVELEIYQANCKRQSEAIVKLKEELSQIKCELAELQEYKYNAEDELRSLNETKTCYEVVQVALQESDTTHASEVKKLKYQISKLESEKEKLSKSNDSLCVELQAITDKCKGLEETIGLLQTQVETYKKDFDTERSERERLAHAKEEAKLSKAVKQQHKFHGDEEIEQVQLLSLQEAYTSAIQKASDYDKEVSDLKQKLQTKEETWKRSLEEARASSSKLEEEVMVLTMMVKQYKKQADNLKSQLEKREQMNKIQVQQPRQSQFVDSDANYQQVKRIAQQPDRMWRRQRQYEDAHVHHLKEHAPSGFPPMENPPDNVYQGYGYQSSSVYASERDPVVKAPPPYPPKYSPRQEASHEDDNLPPPIMLPSLPSPSPVKVRASTVQPYNTPYQQPYQSQSQQSGRYAQTDVGGVNYGPLIHDHSHYQREQVYVNPQSYLGTSAPQPLQPVQNSPQPGAMKEPKSIDLAK